MPGKDLTKKKASTTRHFRLVSKPILGESEDQKSLLQPYIRPNERKKLGHKEAEKKEKELYRPIGNLKAADAFGEDFASEEDYDSEEERQQFPKRLNKKVIGNEEDGKYIIGADYESEEEEINSEDENYFPTDGYLNIGVIFICLSVTRFLNR